VVLVGYAGRVTFMSERKKEAQPYCQASMV